MASKYQKIMVSVWIIILVTILDLGRQTSIEALQTMDKSNFRPKSEGTIKTIEVPEDGELIDCVDIYKQPALKNPLIKDKIIQMKPSSRFSRAFNKTNYPFKMIQNWHKYGKCPKGTVPITRTRNHNDTFHRKYPNNDGLLHEYVQVRTIPSKYFGASALFNVWKPEVTGYNELSLSQMWFVSGTGPELNTLEAGWIVYPTKFKDPETRFFTFWTSDNYGDTGCYNDQCHGFISKNQNFKLGAKIKLVSIYDRPHDQRELYIALDRDDILGHWWLTVNDEEVGYFPREIFSSLKYGAKFVAFGGEIVNNKEGNCHTSTQMGSGHFSSEGFSKASFIRTIRVIDQNYKLIDADITQVQRVSQPTCYSFTMGLPDPNYRSHFFFGGPGYSPQCQ